MNSIKDRVKEKIKEYSNEEYLDGYIRNEFLADDGNANIILKVNNKEELFNSKTSGNQLDLNPDIYEHLEQKASMLNNDIQLHLRIIGVKLNNRDEEIVRHIINEHYAIELYKIQRSYRRYKLEIIKHIVAGLFFVACYAFIALNFSSKFFIEVFGFLFSFTLWQAFETYMYTLEDIKYKREEITQKLIMDIDFSIDDVK